MGRAFGELDAAFYNSGRVMSQRTCVPSPLPRLRPSRHTVTSPRAVPDWIELGGYASVTIDSKDDLADYASYEIEAR